MQPAIESSLYTAHGVVPTDYYGYLHDRAAWEVKMELQESRLGRRSSVCQKMMQLRISVNTARDFQG